MAAKKPAHRPKLRWWQIVCRVAVAAALGILGVYAALPWWAPTDYLRRHIAGELSRQMGVAVRIEEMHLSWSRGVELTALTVESPEGFGPEPMLTVAALRTELSPIDFLLNRHLEWLEVIGPHLRARLDSDGNVNVAPLGRLDVDVAVERIHVRLGRATLELPGEARPVSLRVPTFEFDPGRIRQIAMSAALEQSPAVGEAPVSLSPRAGPSAGSAARASFTFSNVELAELPLAPVLKLPLRKLSGRCSGSADLNVSRDGVVDEFSLRVQIRRLEVQPKGDVTLPVADEAGLRITAAYDHLTGAIRLRSASVRLPGVDLTGEAKVFGELFAGHWEAVESLDFRGKVYPARLAALLTGRRRLAGDVSVTGPMDVTVTAKRQAAKLQLRLAAEATDAVLRREEKVLKPAGRPCRMGLAGNFDHRTSGFDVTDSYLHLAGNRFRGHGALVSLRRFARRLLERRHRTPGEVLLDELARLDWRGEWEIRDLPSLLELLPTGPERPWGDARLRGPLTGRWFIHHGSATRVHAGFVLPPGTQFALGRTFLKPPAAAMHLDFNAAIDANRPALTDLAVEVIVGDGHLDVTQADLVLPAAAGAGRPARPLEFTGRVTAENVEALLACLPRAEALARHAGGAVDGRFAVHSGPRQRRLRLSMDLKNARLSLGPWLDKLAGQAAEAHLDLRADPSAPPAERNLLAATWTSPQGEVTVNGTFPDPPAGALPERVAWVLDATVADAARLADVSPALRRLLADAAVGGKVALKARGTLARGVLDANAFWDATDMAFASDAGGRRRAKAPGTALTLRWSGRWARQEGRLVGQVRRAEARLADSHLSLTGRVELLPDRPTTAGKLWPQPALRGCRLDANASVVVQKALGDLLPELDERVRRHGISGRVVLRADVAQDANSIRVRAHADAAKLAVTDVLAGWDANDVRLPKGLAPEDLRPLTKPANLPAKVELQFTCPADLSRVDLRSFRARVGGLDVLADGSAAFQPGSTGLPAKVGGAALHVAASTRRAEDLAAIAPGLKRFRPAGGLFVEAELTDALAGQVAQATVRFTEFAARFRGSDVRLDGALRLEGLPLPTGAGGAASTQPGALPRIGRLQTDALAFRIGRNRGGLVADLSSLPDKPAGSFHLLAEYLDDRDLSAWLDPPPAGPGATTRPSYKLAEEQVESLRARARELARLGRKHLAAAKITGRVSIRHLRMYDVSVDQTYDVRRLEADVSVEDGLVKLAYAGGVNGGLVTARYSTYLTDAAPVVRCESQLRNLLAEANLQPQIAKFFPGNTVYGTFSKTEETTAPLSEFLAAALDPRYPLRAVGSGKTVAVDGLTQGRAAPKFVTRIFPGLNLAKYRYRKMTGFAELRADGTTYNDMVFDGRIYDLYMEGITGADHVGRYEIGLILLGTPQSAEWNHTYRPGRIPILNFKARIEGGKLHDEEVSYPLPNETLFVIFLKNNIFYRIWLAAGKNKG